MTTLTNHRIGLIGLPGLEQLLREAGAQVVTGEDFRQAARQINATVREHGSFPLIIADESAPGTGPWLEKVLAEVPAVLVQIDLAPAASRIGGNTSQVPRLALPATVEQVLTAIGVQAPDELAAVVFSSDGQVTTSPAGPAAHDDIFDDDALLGEAPAAAPWPKPVPVREHLAPVAEVYGVPTPSAPATPQAPLPPATMHPAPTPAWPIPGSQPVSRPQPAVPAPASLAASWAVAAPAADIQPEIPVPAPKPLADVIFTFAGKGGVGKTSMAMFLAQRAAAQGGLRVVLIDGNRGQGDTRTFLSLSSAGLPTIYDIATGADPSSVFITPTHLTANRRPDAGQLLFALVMAPPTGMSDPEIVTAATYSAALQAARAKADLVIVDTQIAEDSDTSALFDDLWIPALLSYAWGLGISDLSTPGIKNLFDRLAQFSRRGIGPARIATMLNRVPSTMSFNEQATADQLSRYGRFLGRLGADDAVIANTDHGDLPIEIPEVAAMCDRMLFMVTAREVFSPQAPAEPEDKRRRGWWRR